MESAKQQVEKILDTLTDNASLEDIQYHKEARGAEGKIWSWRRAW